MGDFKYNIKKVGEHEYSVELLSESNIRFNVNLLTEDITFFQGQHFIHLTMNEFRSMNSRLCEMWNNEFSKDIDPSGT